MAANLCKLSLEPINVSQSVITKDFQRFQEIKLNSISIEGSDLSIQQYTEATTGITAN